MTAAKKLSTSDKIRLVAPLVVYALLAFGAWKLGYFREQNVEEAARSALSSVWVNTVFVLIFGVVGALLIFSATTGRLSRT